MFYYKCIVNYTRCIEGIEAYVFIYIYIYYIPKLSTSLIDATSVNNFQSKFAT